MSTLIDLMSVFPKPVLEASVSRDQGVERRTVARSPRCDLGIE
jgi:hypothetical protein